MGKRKGQSSKKKAKTEKIREGKYYDANLLTDKKSHREMFNFYGTGLVAVTSSLALGEATRNLIVKSNNPDHAKRRLSYFFNQLTDMEHKGALRLVSAKVAKLDDTRRLCELTELDVQDAQHFIIAIKEGCTCLASADPDICNLSNVKINEIRQEFRLSKFSIKRHQFKEIEDINGLE